MKILVVDDDQTSALAPKLTEDYYIALGYGKVHRLADVISFEKACDAMHWLNSECPVDVRTGKPLRSTKDCPRQYIDNDYPHTAIIDIDFQYKREQKQWGGSVEATLDDKGRLTARLGWPVASKLRRLAPDCEIILYTGKEDVIRDLREACKIVEWNGERVPPYVQVQEKVVSPDNIRDLVKLGLKRVAEKRLYNHGIDVSKLAQFEAMVFPYDQAKLMGQMVELIKEFAEIFEVCPFEAGLFMKFDGEPSKQAAIQIVQICSQVDYHLELRNAFKSKKPPEQPFATPLAAACHTTAWDYTSGLPMERVPGASGILNPYVGLGELDGLKRLEQGRHLKTWLADNGRLPWHAKSVLCDKDLLPWAESYGAGESADWENSFAEIVGVWHDALPPSLQSRINVDNVRSEVEVLTDWGFFFADESSVFNQFVALTNSEAFSAKRGLDWRMTLETIDHVDRSVELIVRITRTDAKHIGSCTGLKGRRVDEQLKYWGRSWYEWSLPPVHGADMTTAIKYWIWPHPGKDEPIVPVPVSEPKIELHWHVPNYLENRKKTV